MAKEAYYFSHDFHSRSDQKMVSLLMKAGIAGVGIYWCIIEMLYEEGGSIMLSECERIAFELRTDASLVRSVIDTNLFEKDDDKFWSKSVIKRLSNRKLKSEKARKSANYRWGNISDANAILNRSERYAIKESK